MADKTKNGIKKHHLAQHSSNQAGTLTFEQANAPAQFHEDTLRVFRSFFHRDPVLPSEMKVLEINQNH